VRPRWVCVEIVVVIAVLLDDAEYAHGRWAVRHAGRVRPLRTPAPVAEQRHCLSVDRDDELQRTFRHFAEAGLLLGLGFLPPGRRDPRLAARHLRGRRIPIPVPPRGKRHAARGGIRRIVSEKKPSYAGSETDAQAPEAATGR